jgi:hypothetical protein
MTFKVKLSGEELNLRYCVLPSCSDDFPSKSLPLSGNRPLAQGGGSGTLCMNRHRKVQLSDSCEATRVVELLRIDNGADDLFDPAPRQRPEVVLVRRLGVSPYQSGAKCDDPSQAFPPAAQQSSTDWTCVDVFAVSIEKK